MEAVSKLTSADALEFARRAIRHEADALTLLAERLGADFLAAVDVLGSCSGNVIVTGMGKAGLIGQKVSATFCSTGTRSHFLHPAEAIHGDLGRVNKDDWVLALSMSGETEEITRLLPSLQAMTRGIVSITSSRTNTLGRSSQHVIELGQLTEAGANGLAPSTTTTAMLALGDALALTICERRGFRPHDFVRFHPGGSLGRKLTKVQEIMRPLAECRVAHLANSVRETFITVRRAGRRTGAVMIVDDDERLVGLFTDSDLARLLERTSDGLLQSPVSDVMTRNPRTIPFDSMMPAAITLLAQNQISELPVIDVGRRPVGMIDITDVIGWLPSEVDLKEESENAPATNSVDRDTTSWPRLLQFPSNVENKSNETNP